ncbi:Cytochrome b-c1 complex subunit 7-2, mitochondrial [Turnera subulata]|uniref:Cytochrome b-c1 complex subunit 7 n=1 Tax=Turnera subulata TaxID=218843 RepID=A0A9Q0FA35_9ROSI|nr:Cytochrome b-c1 complex subunit 7-2, mitochondrial [Turnera subulata]
MSSFLQLIVDPRKNPLAKLHMKSVSKRLRKYGLRYDDLYDPYYDLDIKEALNRLPREIVDARHQRLKRAIDLSMKHEYLPEDLQAMQTPFRSYLQDMLALVSFSGVLDMPVKRERAEREALGALPLYQRTIP